jgi:hypothetical protein
VIDLIAMILEHGVPSTSFNGVTDAIGAGKYQLLEMLLVQMDNLLPQQYKNQKQNAH